MIYFLVNNDYQLFDARNHVDTLRANGHKCSLIEVPHTLQSEDRSNGFASVVTILSPVCRFRWLFAWGKYFFTIPFANMNFCPDEKDILFFYTEYELLNQTIAKYFKKNGAKTYLLEDGGVGSYLPLTLPIDEPYKFKDYVFTFMIRCLPGLWTTRFRKFDGIIVPWLSDDWLDGICLYRPIKSVRSAPVVVLNRQTLPPIEVVAGRVVFLNQPLYDDLIQTPADYFDGLSKIMTALTNGFNEVLFKFHPREELVWIQRISSYLANNYPSVEIINENTAFESQLIKFCPEVVASYNSSPLLNLTGSGIQPMFVYHLLDDLPKQNSFFQLTELLTQWNYNFITTWGEACSGYRSGDSFESLPESISIAELVAHDRNI